MVLIHQELLSMNQKNTNKIDVPKKLIVFILLLSVLIFGIDIALPLGVAGGVPYVAVILVTLWIPKRRTTIVFALLCTFLTLLGYFFSPEGGEVWKVYANRFLALFAIWVTAGIGVSLKKGQYRLKRANERLEERVSKRTDELLGEVAEHKRTEENLVRAQEVAHVGSWQLNLKENNLIWTDENYRIFGVTIGERMNYEKFMDIIHPEDREYVEKKWMAAVKGEPYDIEHRLLIDDTVKWVREKASLTFDDNGKVVSAIGITQEVTVYKRLEDEALKAQKLENLGVIAGGIAHDFNNLLTAILGNIQLLKEMLDPEDKSYKRVLGAEKASRYAAELTKQLLTFSKGGEPVKEVASLGELLEESAAFVLRGSSVVSEQDIDDELYPVEVDKGQINQVINNLLLNAEQAMTEGGVIKISARNVDLNKGMFAVLSAGKYVLVSIEDSGGGIPEEIVPNIFDPYFSTKDTGSGLGLASAYSIIKKHDGSIEVDSTEGEGTTFHVYIPATDKAMDANHLKGEVSFKGRGRVLVLDDEDIVREVISEYLQTLGYKSILSKDGEEAVRVYKAAMEDGAPFDAVVMDLTIRGGMGGKEAMKKLLELDPEVKCIVSSGYSEDPAMSSYKEYGFSDVVVKPYTAPKLGRVLKKVLRA
jgi:signal transduction histidine kinase/ActR/RegA family two-component response regulator